MVDDKDDHSFYEGGNVGDAPGVGHNGGPALEDEDVYAEMVEKLKELEDMPLDDLLMRARKKLFVDLLVAIETGTAGHQDKAILAKLLKDNGMVLGDDPIGADEEEDPTYGETEAAPLPVLAKPAYDE